MTPSPVYAWAIKAPEWSILKGAIMVNWVGLTRKDAIYRHNTKSEWKRMYREGYRCVRVQITEVQG